MIGGLGIWELLLIFFIVLLFFGAKRLPEIGGSLGEGIREFKDSLSGSGDDDRPEIPPGEREDRSTAPGGPAADDAPPGGGEPGR